MEKGLRLILLAHTQVEVGHIEEQGDIVRMHVAQNALLYGVGALIKRRSAFKAVAPRLVERLIGEHLGKEGAAGVADLLIVLHRFT